MKGSWLWITAFLIVSLLVIGTVTDTLGRIRAQEPPPHPEKLDALLASTMFSLPEDAPQAEPSGDGNGEYKTVQRPLDRFPFYTDPDGNVFVDALIQTNGSNEGIEDLGIIIQSQVGTVAAARIPLASLGRLTAFANVQVIQSAQRLSPANYAGGPAIRAPEFRNATGMDGTGVIVGVIDSGIDIFHSDFRNPDGTTRIKFICDQTDPPQSGDDTCAAKGSPGGGTMWTEAKINATLAGAAGSSPVRQQDTVGHGSHVAGSAAGADGIFGGVAPGAHLIIVKTTYATNDIINGIAFIDEKAGGLGLPYVTNMSLGGHGGPHDGTDLMSDAIDDLVGPEKPGKAIVVAAGNEGNDIIHAEGTVSTNDTTIVEFNVPQGAAFVGLNFWYDGQNNFCVGFLDPNNQGLPCIPPADGFLGKCNGSNSVCVSMFHSGTQSRNGDKQVLFIVEPGIEQQSISLSGTWKLTFSGDNGAFDGWINCPRPLICEFGPAHGNTDLTVGEPGVATNAITIGSYVTNNCWDSQIGQECYFPIPAVDDVSPFSSRGPTRDERIKPDIGAPGQAIMSALSSQAPTFIAEGCLGPGLNGTAPDGIHSICQGTSMASPHAAGAAALWLAHDPTMDSDEIKAKFCADAVRDASTGSTPNNAWGCGKLRLVAPPPPCSTPPKSGDWYISDGQVCIVSQLTSIEGDLYLGPGGSLNVSRGQTLNVAGNVTLEPASTLTIAPNASFIIKLSSSHLRINGGAKIVVKAGAQVVAQPGGKAE